jgi:hypothetical protein
VIMGPPAGVLIEYMCHGSWSCTSSTALKAPPGATREVSGVSVQLAGCGR